MRYVLFFMGIFFLSQCQTSKKIDNINEISKGQWEAELFLKNKSKSQSYKLDLDLLAIKPNKLRIEVTTSLGIHLSSIVINEDQTQILLPREKKYFYGGVSRNIFKPLLKFSLDPQIIFNLLFENDFFDQKNNVSSKNWICERDQENKLKKCVDKQNGIQVEWEKNKADEKIVYIYSSAYELKINLNFIKSNFKVKSNTFKIPRPSRYQIYKFK